MNDNLDSLSAAALEELFAVEIALITEMTPLQHGGLAYYKPVTSGYALTLLPAFCSDANAVLPWLETGFCTAYRADGISETIASASPWTIHFRFAHLPPGNSQFGESPTFARAAVIALIRAKRAEPKP